MEIFYAHEISAREVFLDTDESVHCVRVLRHRTGDEISVVDGLGTMMRCRVTDDSPKGVSAEILESFPGWGGHPYSLTMAVCPTKNNDRFEWFVEKATEVGVDRIVPVIGERSERRVFKPERSRKIALSAMKQSLKACLPSVEEPVPVKDFILCGSAAATSPSRSLSLRDPIRANGRGQGLSQTAEKPDNAEGLVASTAVNEIKLICYCFEGETERRSIEDVLREVPEGSDITVMIGPEGDFSPQEAQLAVENGFIPVHLGPSRLRTETAAVTAATAVYLHFMK